MQAGRVVEPETTHGDGRDNEPVGALGARLTIAHLSIDIEHRPRQIKKSYNLPGLATLKPPIRQRWRMPTHPPAMAAIGRSAAGLLMAFVVAELNGTNWVESGRQ